MPAKIKGAGATNPKDRRSPPIPYYVGPMRECEDYRTHHFNTTMPPQLRLHVPGVESAKARTATVQNTQVSYPSLDEAPTANLTAEGKRQVRLVTLNPADACLHRSSRPKLQVIFFELEICHFAVGDLSGM